MFQYHKPNKQSNYYAQSLYKSVNLQYTCYK